MSFSQYDGMQVLQDSHKLDTNSIRVSPIGSPVDVAWDYMSMAISTTSVANDTETYTFKDGGISGTTVKTVVIKYTSGDRDIISSVSIS